MVKKLFKSTWFWLVLVLIVGAILRFWQIGEWQYLTYDQSRDYLIIKKLIVDHKFTLVGPTVSIAPGFYLPPFYYYSLVPFLLLFDYHLLGPDVYTALLGVGSIFLLFLTGRDFFGKPAALLVSFLYAVNPYLIHTSRHAWNPNTVFFFILLFVYSCQRYLFFKKRKYLALASFSLAWAIGLHLTVVVFLPLLFYLYFLEVKNKRLDGTLFLSFFLFFLIFLPLFLFDFRHNFPIVKAGLSYLGKQGGGSSFAIEAALRFKEALLDIVKMPVVLLSGLYQNLSLTIRPSNITAFSEIKLFSKISLFDFLKLVAAGLVWGLALFYGVFRGRKERKQRFVLIMFLAGLAIRLFFATPLFYFYYYLAVFPFVFLLLGFLIKKVISKGKYYFAGTAVLTVMVGAFSILPGGIYYESRNESYFLPSCEAIAADFKKGEKIAIAGNLKDNTRWEKNGLEYRYFLEAFYKIPLGGWDVLDYQNADVLYLIDEGDLRYPLELGGMEMEAFGPGAIEKTWEVQTGQKIYKLIKQATKQVDN